MSVHCVNCQGRPDKVHFIFLFLALDFLVQLLHSTDEIIIGNTALCLSHCADMGKGYFLLCGRFLAALKFCLLVVGIGLETDLWAEYW